MFHHLDVCQCYTESYQTGSNGCVGAAYYDGGASSTLAACPYLAMPFCLWASACNLRSSEHCCACCLGLIRLPVPVLDVACSWKVPITMRMLALCRTYSSVTGMQCISR